MAGIHYIEREMTDAEYARECAGFDEHTLSHGNPVEAPERHGFVAMDGEAFIGCASGLAYISAEGYSRWFYLSDLYVEEPYRGRGVGWSLLRLLEMRVAALGIERMWTWTAGYEAPGFYRRHGYEVFAEMERWYARGESRYGLWKRLAGGAANPDTGDES